MVAQPINPALKTRAMATMLRTGRFMFDNYHGPSTARHGDGGSCISTRFVHKYPIFDTFAVERSVPR